MEDGSMVAGLILLSYIALLSTQQPPHLRIENQERGGGGGLNKKSTLCHVRFFLLGGQEGGGGGSQSQCPFEFHLGVSKSIDVFNLFSPSNSP
jgi:hypothetical protein